MIEVKNIPNKGRGVVASTDIKSGEVITKDPVCEIPVSWDYPPGVDNYRMSWTDQEDVLALGLSMLLNHSENSNVSIENDYENRLKVAIAKRDILSGEELTITYKCPLWFEVND